MCGGLQKVYTIPFLFPVITGAFSVQSRQTEGPELTLSSSSWGSGLGGDLSAIWSRDTAGSNFTVLVNTFRRADCLRQVLQHWLSCSPGEVRVVWSEGASAVPSWLEELEHSKQVVVDRYESNRLTNRFHPQAFRHEAVFTVDDDIYYNCASLHGAFQAFQKDTRRIVGFAPRLLGQSGYVHDGAFKSHKANTLFVTKGAFVPSRLFTAYFSPEFAKPREVVDMHTTAEDILMSFVYARQVGLPVVPLVVEQRNVHKLWPCGGVFGRQLMTRPGSNEIRRSIITSLFDAFGDPFGDLETDTFVNVETAGPVNMATAPFVDVIAGRKEMPHGGRDFLVI
mmetsp:Transcript_177431/g.431602  ORF Transcript_177431/g.431602 Transcript_177431/m.431602 type:complete len:338 (+) Transcript_177431:79-1092(+)